VKVKSIIGEKFGRLLVTDRPENDKRGASRWVCRCQCGEEKIVRGAALRGGGTRSCGCLRLDVLAERFRNQPRKVKLHPSFAFGGANRKGKPRKAPEPVELPMPEPFLPRSLGAPRLVRPSA
jgi:hypothetical protein